MPSQINPAIGTTPSAATQTKQQSDGANLDKNDFLKLFVAQMQHQDPSQPMDNSQMMAQMASFSSLEQMSNMAAANQQANAVGLIGKTVTYKDKLGVETTGVVDRVTTESGQTSLVVGNVKVKPDSIVEVSGAAPAANPAAAAKAP